MWLKEMSLLKKKGWELEMEKKKKDVWKFTKKEKRKVKVCIYQSKKEVNEQFGRT